MNTMIYSDLLRNGLKIENWSFCCGAAGKGSVVVAAVPLVIAVGVQSQAQELSCVNRCSQKKKFLIF